MSEHEKLKEIIDLIEYEYYDFFAWNIMSNKFYPWYNREAKQDEFEWDPVSVTEIIFSPEFMDKLVKYYYWNFWRTDWVMDTDYITPWIMNNLEDPVDFIYNLLELWTNTQTKK